MKKASNKAPTRYCIPWFVARAGGCAWSFVLVDGATIREANGGRPCDGMTVEDQLLVFLNGDIADERITVVALHECKHVCHSGPGAVDTSARVWGCKEEDVFDREEAMISYETPSLAELLTSIGALRFPKLPKRPR